MIVMINSSGPAIGCVVPSLTLGPWLVQCLSLLHPPHPVSASTSFQTRLLCVYVANGCLHSCKYIVLYYTLRRSKLIFLIKLLNKTLWLFVIFFYTYWAFGFMRFGVGW